MIAFIISFATCTMPPPLTLPTNLEPMDIWRSAKLLVKRHGDQAPLQCALNADAMLEAGDPDGQRVWLAIRRAAQSLLENGPPPDVPNGPAH